MKLFFSNRPDSAGVKVGGWHSLKTADIWRRYDWFHRQMTSEKRAQKFQIWVGASVLALCSFFRFICNVLGPPPFIRFYTPLSFPMLRP